MTQTQFLLLLIALIPAVNCLIIKFCDNSSPLIAAIQKVLPLLFLVNVIGILGNFNRDNSYLVLTEAARGISLGFDVDRLALGFLFLLAFFWLILTFYFQRFLQISETKNSVNLKAFFALLIALINLIIISKNLLSILFFYNCLIVICHFFSIKFLHKKQTKFTYFFTFLLYLESVLFFLATVATYKFFGQIDFKSGGIVGENLESIKYILLLSCYIFGLFLSVLAPIYLLYRDINLDLIVIYALFFLAYAFSSIYIFLKILNSIFGVKAFAIIFVQNGLEIFQWIFLFNITVSSVCLLFSKGLKSSFFYLLFQQFTFALFALFLFAAFDESKTYVPIFSFFLSLTLLFLTVSNCVLYLQKAENKNVFGIFYDLKITITLFIFTVFNMIGIAPAIGGIEKFFLLKIIFKQNLLVCGMVFLVNFVALSFFCWKVFYPFFWRNKENSRLQSDLELAKAIDFDSSLILTALTVAITMLLSLIFFPLLTEFL